MIIDDAQTIEELLIRHLGVIDQNIQNYFKQRSNPIILFKEGVQIILLLPVYFLNWFGLLSLSTINSFSKKPAFSIISAFVGIFSFISAVVGFFCWLGRIYENRHKYFPLMIIAG